ncbi:MAG: TlyA family rRNA (cytidine-2'-O)-methyltransferase, partial [Acidobacteriota bacterium]
EASRGQVGPGGVIRDQKLQREIVDRVRQAAVEEGLTFSGEVASPLEGRKGNREFFLFLRSRG